MLCMGARAIVKAATGTGGDGDGPGNATPIVLAPPLHIHQPMLLRSTRCDTAVMCRHGSIPAEE